MVFSVDVCGPESPDPVSWKTFGNVCAPEKGPSKYTIPLLRNIKDVTMAKIKSYAIVSRTSWTSQTPPVRCVDFLTVASPKSVQLHGLLKVNASRVSHFRGSRWPHANKNKASSAPTMFRLEEAYGGTQNFQDNPAIR